MEECHNNLRAKGTFPVLFPSPLLTFVLDHRFETPNKPPPPTMDDDVRQREEEELQRIHEMLIHDRGGRDGLFRRSLPPLADSEAGTGRVLMLAQ